MKNKNYFYLCMMSFLCGAISFAMQQSVIIKSEGKYFSISREVAQQSDIINTLFDFNPNDKKNKLCTNIDFSGVKPYGIKLDKDTLNNLFCCVKDSKKIRRIRGSDKLHQLVLLADFLMINYQIKNRLLWQMLHSNINMHKLHPVVLENSRDLLLPWRDGSTLDFQRKNVGRAESFLEVFDEKERTQITTIDLSSNRLKKIKLDKIITLFPNLRLLNVSSNEIEKLYCTRFPYFFELRCSCNSLQKITIASINTQQGLRIKCDNNQLGRKELTDLRGQLRQTTLGFRCFRVGASGFSTICDIDRDSWKAALIFFCIGMIPMLHLITFRDYFSKSFDYNTRNHISVLIAPLLIFICWPVTMTFYSIMPIMQRGLSSYSKAIKERLERYENKLDCVDIPPD